MSNRIRNVSMKCQTSSYARRVLAYGLVSNSVWTGRLIKTRRARENQQASQRQERRETVKRVSYMFGTTILN